MDHTIDRLVLMINFGGDEMMCARPDDCLTILLEGTRCGKALVNNPLQHLLGTIIVAPNELLRLLKRNAGAVAIMASQSFHALPAEEKQVFRFACIHYLWRSPLEKFVCYLLCFMIFFSSFWASLRQNLGSMNYS